MIAQKWILLTALALRQIWVPSTTHFKLFFLNTPQAGCFLLEQKNFIIIDCLFAALLWLKMPISRFFKLSPTLIFILWLHISESNIFTYLILQLVIESSLPDPLSVILTYFNLLSSYLEFLEVEVFGFFVPIHRFCCFWAKKLLLKCDVISTIRIDNFILGWKLRKTQTISNR